MSIRKTTKITALIGLVFIIGVLIAPSVFADTTLISPIPNQGNAGKDLGSYISAIFTYGIGLAALIAMAQLVFGAVQYTTSAGVPSLQEDAKSRMRGAIVGIVLLLISTLILISINKKFGSISLDLPPPAPPEGRPEDRFERVNNIREGVQGRLSREEEFVNQSIQTLAARVGHFQTGGTTLQAIRSTFANPSTPVETQREVMNWMQTAWDRGMVRAWGGPEYSVLQDLMIESYSLASFNEIEGSITRSDFNHIFDGLSQRNLDELRSSDPFGRRDIPVDRRYAVE